MSPLPQDENKGSLSFHCLSLTVALSVSQFSGIIVLIFFLELAMAVLAFTFQEHVREWINDFFLQNVKAYRDDIDLQNLIDSLQRMVRDTGSSGTATLCFCVCVCVCITLCS